MPFGSLTSRHVADGGGACRNRSARIGSNLSKGADGQIGWKAQRKFTLYVSAQAVATQKSPEAVQYPAIVAQLPQRTSPANRLKTLVNFLRYW
jgi:hypothetical protein